DPLETGSPIMMSINIGVGTLDLKGVVVYSDPGHGVGVRFKDLSAADESILSRELDLS
ncbi:MAG: PilZ domain-containing protein, partial [Pyrinomonadaceae bacterium]